MKPEQGEAWDRIARLERELPYGWNIREVAHDGGWWTIEVTDAPEGHIWPEYSYGHVEERSLEEACVKTTEWVAIQERPLPTG